VLKDFWYLAFVSILQDETSHEIDPQQGHWQSRQTS
jgi:hypothetical protein